MRDRFRLPRHVGSRTPSSEGFYLRFWRMWLPTWAETEETNSKEQASFRKGYSTIDHIVTFLISLVKNNIDSRRGGKVYAAFVDHRKAFDTVDRDKLYDKLEKLKISSTMINRPMTKLMYCCARSCVRWGAKLSEFFECFQGVN